MYQFDTMYSADVEEPDVLKKQIERTVSQAKQCLNTAEFAEYKKQFTAIKDKMVQSMIAYTNGFMAQDSADMCFYGAKMSRMITKLQDLQALLDAVGNDVRKERTLDAEG